MISMGRAAVPVLLALGLLAAGRGGDGEGTTAPGVPEPRVATERSTTPPSSPPARVAPAPEPKPAPRCTASTTVRSAGEGVAAVLDRPTTAHRSPGGPAIARFGLRNANGVPTTFRVLQTRLGPDCRPAWYRVQLPVRPNGARGWIRAGAARRYVVDYRIVVDLSDRVVTVFRAGKELVRTPTAIGRGETPTPTGSFYVNQRLLSGDASGPFGPGGIGISAFSPVLTGWAQGGPIAIHGTNQPESIGFAVSNGCLRIANDVLERLIHQIPDGTPVQIRA
jgi:lipoprotein-anchoring transpeptidase ErfK/SrfK